MTKHTISVAERIRRIQQIDLEPIMVKLVREHEWTQEFVELLVEQYRNFLALTVMHPGTSIVPSSAVDEVWHAHILDTIKYQEDCEWALGTFLHHFPYFGIRGPEDAENLQRAFEHTQKLMREAFGADYTIPRHFANAVSPAICDAAAAICDAGAAICDSSVQCNDIRPRFTHA